MRPVVVKARTKELNLHGFQHIPKPLPENQVGAFSRGTVLREFAQSAFAAIVLFLIFGGTWLTMHGEKVRAKYLQEKVGTFSPSR